MRKKLAVLIAVITAAMMLFGCGGKDMSGSEYLGKWKATKAEYAGIEVGVDTVFDEFHFTLTILILPEVAVRSIMDHQELLTEERAEAFSKDERR